MVLAICQLVSQSVRFLSFSLSLWFNTNLGQMKQEKNNIICTIRSEGGRKMIANQARMQHKISIKFSKEHSFL